MNDNVNTDIKLIKALVMTAEYAMAINELLILKGIYTEEEFCNMYDRMCEDDKKPDKQYLFLKVYNKDAEVNEEE